MNDNRTLIVNTLLQEIAEELDIPPSKYQEAVERYTAVGRWLEAGSYDGVSRIPTIYPQGSFRLGTVVRPYRNGVEKEYDIDLACELNCALCNTTAKNTKHSVRDRINEHGTYRNMLDKEGRRCWTLMYAEADGIGFHLDVLPCITNPIYSGSGVHGLKAVEITDRVGDTSYAWSKSNPAGFADWFEERQRPAFNRVAALRKSQIQRQHPGLFARVDDVPNQLVRTPLQRAIQILKRHRDVRFAGKENELDRPISVIITTLAALAYQQENDVLSTFANFLDRVQRFSDTGIIRCENDKWVISNPVNPHENFADRWNDKDSKKSDAFFQWLNWLQEDLDELLNASTSIGLHDRLVETFGEHPGNLVANRYSGQLPGAQQVPKSIFQRVAGRLRFDVPHRQNPQWHVSPTRYKAEVSAKFLRNGFRPTAFTSNCRPLSKGGQLIFEATTNVPKPYTVYWQVVNTGGEAARASQLRGEFYDSHSSGKNRNERTAYTGMHWVECFVVQNGICVARSGEFVVNIA